MNRVTAIRYRASAVRLLEISANNGLPLHEVHELLEEHSVIPLQFARAARDRVLSLGVHQAVKLEAAALLRDGWRP